MRVVTFGGRLTRQGVAARREAEAREAAHLLGIAEVVVLGYPDSGVEDSPALRKDLVAAIRRWCPDLVFTHDPEQPYPPYLSHRDHRVVGRATLDAIYPLARDQLAFPELQAADLLPHIVRGVWLFASVAAEAAVDISQSFERKLAARLAHASQTSDPLALAVAWRLINDRAVLDAGFVKSRYWRLLEGALAQNAALRAAGQLTPSRFCIAGEEGQDGAEPLAGRSLSDLLAELDGETRWAEANLVLKPVISADGIDTFVYTASPAPSRSTTPSGRSSSWRRRRRRRRSFNASPATGCGAGWCCSPICTASRRASTR